MSLDTSASKINISDITLAPYYIVGVIATTIGLLVILILNFFTPLDIIQTRILGQHQVLTWKIIITVFLPRFLFVLGISYIFIISCVNRMLKPISECLTQFKSGFSPEKELVGNAQRRLLNLHFLFVTVNVSLWILIPSFLGIVSILTGVADHRTVIILSARACMVGLVASAVVSQRVETISRKQLIPFFFPNGRLTQLDGTSKISISKRITLANRLGAIIPVTILLVTLVTLQWELEINPVSAITYGRGLITFTFILFIWTILFSKELSRLLSHNIVGPINNLVEVLQNVQKGQFNQKAQILSNDEIGFAGEVVNEMTKGLEEREKMQHSLNLAREIQQNLLPNQNPKIPGLDIAGASIYCDETGGDYYDFLLPEIDLGNKIRIVLGDVSGHGISSALLMATSRALFRQRSAMPGNLAQVTTDVNRLLCQDVKDSGNFMTPFCVEMDMSQKCLKWVRAGHDPALLYDSKQKKITELKGDGIALGIDSSWQYKEHEIANISNGHIAVFYTDGIWEAQNSNGKRFGKENLYRIVKENAHLPSQQILELAMDEVNQFQKGQKHQDDATLIIVKVCQTLY